MISEEIKKKLDNIPTIDLHQDLLPYDSYRKDAIYKNQTSWELLLKNNIKIVLPTANSWEYFYWKDKKPKPELLDLYEKEFLNYNKYISESKNFEIIKNKKDFDRVWESNDKNGVVLHLEGIDYFEDIQKYWEKLERWYSEYNWRSFGLVWNIKNEMSGGTETPEYGITELGKKVLNWVVGKNMILDYAHMNRKVFWEVRQYLKENFIEQYEKPIYVSHSAIDTLHKDERNLNNEQLEEIKKTNGVVGIFFAQGFLNNDVKKGKTTISDIIDHIDYIKNNFGINHVAIGTDLGGFLEEMIDGLTSLNDINNFKYELYDRGYSIQDIEKVFYGNSKRVVRELLK